ncbi:MAG: divergent PAP2 family protein [Anaerolineaceae bacterium]|nr:divergent PAP2 family protein [Anaerolineaceae bacterium]
MIDELFQNKVLIAALSAWAVGQFLKFPLDYLLNKRWNWGIMLSSGGMPSSHSALVTAVALSIGFRDGFDTSVFALSVAIAMVIIYDAAGVRRQAGIHAERINEIMKNFIENRIFPEEDLKEMLGHTPFEVITGVLLGVLVSLILFTVLPA